ncbi:hypothetical protein KCU90_g3107, partial [Aureobasidium melanogenum]
MRTQHGIRDDQSDARQVAGQDVLRARHFVGGQHALWLAIHATPDLRFQARFPAGHAVGGTLAGGHPHDRLQDRTQIADRHPLLQQLPQHTRELHRAHRLRRLGNQFAEFDRQLIEQEACFLGAENVGGRTLARLRQMIAERLFHRRLVQLRIAKRRRRRGRHPDRFFRARPIAFHAFERDLCRVAAHQHVPCHQRAASERHVLDIDDIAAQLAERAIQRLGPQRIERLQTDPQTQRRARTQFNVVENAWHVVAAVARHAGHQRALRVRRQRCVAQQRDGEREQEAGRRHKLDVRKTRDRGQRHAGGPGHADRLRMHRELPVDVAAQMRVGALARAHARHQNARRHRDDQRRNLRDEAVAHGENRVGLQRVGERHATLRDPHRQAADDVHQRHHEARHRVALDELHRAIGVDTHLPPGNTVEREARRHFRDAVRALRDHDELDRRQHDEHHQPHGHVAAHHQRAERADDLAGVRMQQNHLGRSDRECEAQQGGQQQQGGKARQFRRLRHVQRGGQHHQAGREAHADE